jgi:hypothetical protein
MQHHDGGMQHRYEVLDRGHAASRRGSTTGMQHHDEVQRRPPGM